MSYENMEEADQAEMARLRRLLYRAVRELDYIHSVDQSDGNLITSAEGKDIVNSGMKLLGVADLSRDDLPKRLVTA